MDEVFWGRFRASGVFVFGGEDFSEFEIEIEIEKANCTMV